MLQKELKLKNLPYNFIFSLLFLSFSNNWCAKKKEKSGLSSLDSQKAKGLSNNIKLKILPLCLETRQRILESDTPYLEQLGARAAYAIGSTMNTLATIADALDKISDDQ